MAAATTDKFKKTYNAANPNVARVTSSRTAGGASLACDNLAGWPTDTGVAFITYQINTAGAVVAGTQIDWVGVVSGNNIGTLTRVTGATDAGSAIGDVVEMTPTGSWANDIITALLVEHTQAGVHALTSSSTLTSSKFITALNDTNGNELLKVTPTASAVNEFTVANAATGNAPNLSATGGDTNIDLKLTPKGTGRVVIGGAGAAASTSVATSETTTSTSYVGLTTPCAATVTIGTSGMAQVTTSHEGGNSGADSLTLSSYALSGANTVAATDANCLKMRLTTATATERGSATTVLTGLTAGSTTFTQQYKVTSGTGTFLNRNISVIPL